MPDYSDEDLRQASRFIAHFLEADGTDDVADGQPVQIEEHLAVADVETDAQEFASELAFVENLETGFPGVSVSTADGVGTIPVALSLVGPWPTGLHWRDLRQRNWRRDSSVYEWASVMRRTLQLGSADGDIRGFTLISPDEARRSFSTHATDFLATRMAALRQLGTEPFSRGALETLLRLPQRAGGTAVLTPGCEFTVTTNSPGLRVFWSGAYRLSANYFSHPTTPVSSVLQSGTYIFGVDGGAYGNTVQWDTSARVLLPGVRSAHLNF